MIWQDLMLDRWVDEAALRTAVASSFGVPADAVAIVDRPQELSAIGLHVRVVLERVRQEREFPLQLTVVFRDDTLANRYVDVASTLRVVRTLAGQLAAMILFADGPLSPSEWVRVRPSGEIDAVSLDVDETGKVDSFFVVAERELTDASGMHPPEPRRITA